MHSFELRAHVNGVETSVGASGARGSYVVNSPVGQVPARGLATAVRRAAEHVGPALAKAQLSGACWGLYVTAGGAAALFGEWTPVEAPPQVDGDPRDRASEIARIHDEWRNHDGSPRGALDAAIRIVEIYTECPTVHRAA